MGRFNSEAGPARHISIHSEEGDRVVARVCDFKRKTAGARGGVGRVAFKTQYIPDGTALFVTRFFTKLDSGPVIVTDMVN